MTLLPLFNQYIFPTFLSFYAVFSSFFPHPVGIHEKTKVTLKNEKNVAAAFVTPTPSTFISRHKNQSVSDDKQDTTYSTVTAEPTAPQKEKGQTTATGLDTTNVFVTPSISSPAPTTGAQVSHIISAAATITTAGKTIHLFMKYPSLGGTISGTLSGDCTGTISGTYDGPTTPTLSGKGNATCSMGFLTISPTISFSGKLLSPTDAQLTYTVSALGKTDSGSTNLLLSL